MTMKWLFGAGLLVSSALALGSSPFGCYQNVKKNVSVKNVKISKSEWGDWHLELAVVEEEMENLGFALDENEEELEKIATAKANKQADLDDAGEKIMAALRCGGLSPHRVSNLTRTLSMSSSCSMEVCSPKSASSSDRMKDVLFNISALQPNETASLNDNISLMMTDWGLELYVGDDTLQFFKKPSLCKSESSCQSPYSLSEGTMSPFGGIFFMTTEENAKDNEEIAEVKTKGGNSTGASEIPPSKDSWE